MNVVKVEDWRRSSLRLTLVKVLKRVKNFHTCESACSFLFPSTPLAIFLIALWFSCSRVYCLKCLKFASYTQNICKLISSAELALISMEILPYGEFSQELLRMIKIHKFNDWWLSEVNGNNWKIFNNSFEN